MACPIPPLAPWCVAPRRKDVAPRCVAARRKDVYYQRGLKAFNVLAALATGGLGVSCTINEGKGRLKSWTLCDGFGEGVKG